MRNVKSFHWKNFLGVLGGLLAIAVSTQAQDIIPGVGAGIVFPAPQQALIVNPSALPSAAPLSATASWRFDIDQPHLIVQGARTGLGVGLDFRRDPKINNREQNIFQAGGGAAFGPLGVGAVIRKRSNVNADIDLGGHIDLALLKFALIIRSFEDRINRVDFGVGVNLGLLQFSADFKKPTPTKDYKKVYLVDLSARAQVAMVTVGFGSYFQHLPSGWEDTQLHAGASLQATNNIAIDLQWRPIAQEWASTKDTVLLGIRSQF